MQRTSGFHLIPDVRLSAIDVSPEPIVLSSRPTYVGVDPELTVSEGCPELFRRGVLFESVRVNSDARLAMVTAQGSRSRVRINGAPSPCVALLGVGDEVRIDDRLHLHVTVFRAPKIGVAGDAHDGKTCPLCRSGIGRDDWVYVCDRCGSALHCEPEGDPPSETEGDDRSARLPCAQLAAECSCCGTSISLEQGYAHVPSV